MTLKQGWLTRQLGHVTRDVQEWPDWMKREAGFGEYRRIQNLEAGDRTVNAEIAKRPESSKARGPEE